MLAVPPSASVARAPVVAGAVPGASARDALPCTCSAAGHAPPDSTMCPAASRTRKLKPPRVSAAPSAAPAGAPARARVASSSRTASASRLSTVANARNPASRSDENAAAMTASSALADVDAGETRRSSLVGIADAAHGADRVRGPRELELPRRRAVHVDDVRARLETIATLFQGAARDRAPASRRARRDVELDPTSGRAGGRS